MEERSILESEIKNHYGAANWQNFVKQVERHSPKSLVRISTLLIFFVMKLRAQSTVGVAAKTMNGINRNQKRLLA